MKQFIKFDTKLLNTLDNANEMVAYSLICDRMESSAKRDSFFDAKMNDHYVIYTREELAEQLSISVRTAGVILSGLIKKGLIVAKRQFNSASKLFLPQYAVETTGNNESEDSAVTLVQNSHINHTNNNHTNTTSNTYNTHNGDNSVLTRQQAKTEVQNQSKNIHQFEIEALADALRFKAGLPNVAVNVLKVFSFGDSKVMYRYAGLIFKAKSVVKKHASGLVNSVAALSFEINKSLADGLATTLKRVLIKSGHLQNKNTDGYIMTSLINYFDESANDYLQHANGIAE